MEQGIIAPALAAPTPAARLGHRVRRVLGWAINAGGAAVLLADFARLVQQALP